MKRRQFLTLCGSLGGAVFGGCQQSSHPEPTRRYLIDATAISDSTYSEIDIVHNLSAVNVLVGYAHPETLASVPSHQERTAGFSPGATVATATGGLSPETDLYPLQWDKKSQSIREVHDVTRGSGAVVATVGTGVLNHHPDLAPSLNRKQSVSLTEDEWNHSPIGGRTHGTHIAGTIAASSRHGGVTGIAPAVDLIDIRVVSDNGMRVGDMIAGLVHAIKQESDVVNLSQNWYPYTSDKNNDFLLDALRRVVDLAEDQGTVLVCSAGNNSAELAPDSQPFSLPVNLDRVVAVSATAPKGFARPIGSNPDYVGEYPTSNNLAPDEPPETPTEYTNYGEDVLTVSAPGGRFNKDSTEAYPENHYDAVLSTSFSFSLNDSAKRRKPSYGWEAGTSFAAPQVTGALALLKSEYPELQPEGVRTHLRRTAADISPSEYRGAGHLDIEALLGTEPI